MLPCALARRSGNLEGLAVGFDIFFAVCAWLDRLCLGEGKLCAAVGARGEARMLRCALSTYTRAPLAKSHPVAGRDDHHHH